MTHQSFPPMSDWIEDAWLRRYLARELDADETEWFEAYVLDKPHLLQRIEHDSDLRDALDVVSSSGEFHLKAAIESVERPQASPRTSEALRGVRWFAIAASFLGGAAIVGISRVVPSEPAVVNPPRLIFDAFRGAYSEPRREEGAPDSPVLIVDFALPERLEIVAIEARIDGSVRALPIPRRSSEGFGTLVVPSNWRGRARFHLSIRPAEGSAGPSQIKDMEIGL